MWAAGQLPPPPSLEAAAQKPGGDKTIRVLSTQQPQPHRVLQTLFGTLCICAARAHMHRQPGTQLGCQQKAPGAPVPRRKKQAWRQGVPQVNMMQQRGPGDPEKPKSTWPQGPLPLLYSYSHLPFRPSRCRPRGLCCLRSCTPSPGATPFLYRRLLLASSLSLSKPAAASAVAAAARAPRFRLLLWWPLPEVEPVGASSPSGPSPSAMGVSSDAPAAVQGLPAALQA